MIRRRLRAAALLALEGTGRTLAWRRPGFRLRFSGDGSSLHRQRMIMTAESFTRSAAIFYTLLGHDRFSSVDWR